MKTIYLLSVAAGLLFASCQKDADYIQPVSALRESPSDGGDPAAAEMQDWLSTGTWTVDTLLTRVVVQGRNVDTAYVKYGTYEFKRPVVNEAGRFSNGPLQAIHIHPDWNGRIITDTLHYYIGDYDAAAPSPHLLTVWQGDAATAEKVVFTAVRPNKKSLTYESRAAVVGEDGEEQVLVRRFTITR
jgi:hypothetical protein